MRFPPLLNSVNESGGTGCATVERPNCLQTSTVRAGRAPFLQPCEAGRPGGRPASNHDNPAAGDWGSAVMQGAAHRGIVWVSRVVPGSPYGNSVLTGASISELT